MGRRRFWGGAGPAGGHGRRRRGVRWPSAPCRPAPRRDGIGAAATAARGRGSAPARPDARRDHRRRRPPRRCMVTRATCAPAPRARRARPCSEVETGKCALLLGPKLERGLGVVDVRQTRGGAGRGARARRPGPTRGSGTAATRIQWHAEPTRSTATAKPRTTTGTRVGSIRSLTAINADGERFIDEPADSATSGRQVRRRGARAAAGHRLAEAPRRAVPGGRVRRTIDDDVSGATARTSTRRACSLLASASTSAPGADRR